MQVPKRKSKFQTRSKPRSLIRKAAQEQLIQQERLPLANDPSN
jgi:hypothetical protein